MDRVIYDINDDLQVKRITKKTAMLKLPHNNDPSKVAEIQRVVVGSLVKKNNKGREYQQIWAITTAKKSPGIYVYNGKSWLDDPTRKNEVAVLKSLGKYTSWQNLKFWEERAKYIKKIGKYKAYVDSVKNAKRAEAS